VLVEKTIHDRVVAEIVRRAKAIYVGGPDDPRTETGPLISKDHLAKVETYMQSNTHISEWVEYPSCTYPDRQHPFLINSKPYYQINGSPGHGSSGIMMAVGNLFPLWLKAGEVVQTTCPDNFLSIIEYNVVP
jgi:hypothetical protein